MKAIAAILTGVGSFFLFFGVIALLVVTVHADTAKPIGFILSVTMVFGGLLTIVISGLIHILQELKLSNERRR